MKNFIKKHDRLFVFFLYIILTLILTSPVVFKISTDIPGNVDAFQVLAKSYEISKTYNFNNFQESLKTLSYVLNPLRIFTPDIHRFVLHSIFGEPFAYNLYWLLSFVLAGFGAYLLVNYLTKNKIAAFISGVIYSFAPLHFVYGMGFGGATHIEWIPFFVLFLLKYIYNPTIKNVFLAGLFFALVVSSDHHFALYIVMFALFILGYFIIAERRVFKNKKLIIYSLIIGVLAMAFVIWYFLPLIKITFSEKNFLSLGLGEAAWYVADLVGFITPSYLHPLWGDFFQKKVAFKFTGNRAENTVYIGFIALFLSIYALIHFKKDKKTILWGICAFVFSIFALGPFLHILGPLKQPISMPYLLLYKYVPFFENIRATARIFIIALFSFSVLSGYGIRILFEKYNREFKSKLVLPSVIFIIVLVEFWSTPLTSSIAIHPFYKFLARDQDDYRILQPLAASNYAFASDVYYYNSIHRKNSVGFDLALFVRPVGDIWKSEKQTPVINELLFMKNKARIDGAFIAHDFEKISNYFLNGNKIRYIIIHKDVVVKRGSRGPKDFVDFINFIEENIKLEKIIDDEELLVYFVEDLKIQKIPSILKIGKGWSNEEWFFKDWNNEKVLLRYIKNKEATLLLDPPSSQPLELDFSAATLDPEVIDLEVYLNNQKVKEFKVEKWFKRYKIWFENNNQNINEIKFKVRGESQKTVKFIDLEYNFLGY